QKLYFALVPEPGDCAADARGVKPGQQVASCPDELALKLHLLLERGGPRGNTGTVALLKRSNVGHAELRVQEVGPRLRRERVQHALRQGGTPGHEHFKHRKRGGDRYAVLHQIEDHVVHRPGLHLELAVALDLVWKLKTLARLL